mgnify:CR=1 FL=1
MLTIVNTAPNLQASDLDQFGLRFWRKDSEGGTAHHAGLGLALALALAHAIDRSASVEDALEAYARARRRHVRLFQALSYALTPFYQSDSSVLPFVRDRLVATVARIPPAPQVLASMVAGTVIDPFKAIGLKEMRWPGIPGE